MGLRDIKLDPHLTLTCLLLFLVIPSPVVSVTLLSNKGETSFLGNGTSSVTSTVDVPIVNKCCPLGERWTSGACVKSPPLSRIVRRSTPESEIETLEEQSSEHDANSSSHGFTDPDLPVAFRLRVSMPTCSSSMKVISKIIEKEVLRKERMLNVSQVFHAFELGKAKNHSVFLSTEGNLIWKDAQGLINLRQYNDFCIDQINETAFVALICEPRCDEIQPCVRKCCNPGHILDTKKADYCVEIQNEWTPFLYNETLSLASESANQRVHYVFGVPECDSYDFSPRQNLDSKMYILTNGSLVTARHGRKVFYPPDMFCVDGAVEYLPDPENSDELSHFSERHEPIYFSGSELDQVAVICYPPLQETITEEDYWRFNTYPWIELTSSLFLLLTAFVYLILWEYQNIHGWLQFAYVTSCFVSFTFLAMTQLFTTEINEVDQSLCESMGAIIHFSFLAAFFWLTSMNFDLWWTFSGCHPLRHHSRTGEKRRFAIFAIFSWGCPGIIAGIGLALDFIYKGQADSGVIRPRFGERKCYFYGDMEKLPYFYGPVGVLLLIDLVFFINTVYSIQKLQKDTKFATRQSSKQDKQRFALFMKIFIVMGVVWIFEVINWIVEVYKANKSIRNIFVIFDVINALQGLWIFIIFTCKPKTCRQLEGKFKKLTTFMEQYRDQETPETIRRPCCGTLMTCFSIGACALFLPIVHCFRRVFSICGHRARSLSESRRTQSNMTTITSGTFEKSRKSSDCSTASTFTTTDPGSSYEMDSKTSRAIIFPI